MMFVGIQAEEGKEITEDSLVSYFNNKGLKSDDEFIFDGDKKFSYFVAEEANYMVLKEENDLDFFTENLISYLSTVNGSITVKDEEQEEDDGFLYIGNVKQFLKVWSNLD